MSIEDPTAAFRVEARELLDQVEQALLDLSHRLDDAALIDSVFRGLHTLKGSGAMFGFDALAAFTHHIESAFDRVRKGRARATLELVATVLAARDHMRALVEGDAVPNDGAAILARLAAAVDAPATEPAAPPRSPGREAATAGWRLSFRLPRAALAHGTNALALLDELRALGDCTVTARRDTIPPLDQLAERDCLVAWDAELRGDVPRAAIDDVFLFVLDGMELSVTPLAPADAAITAAEAAPVPESAREPDRSAFDQPAPDTFGERRARVAQGELVRVPAARLDTLMDRVGELVIAQSRLSQLAGDRHDLPLRSVAEEVERLAAELRDTMMVLRMVPVASLFGRFRRLVHDLARETGKAIALETTGESTEIDKSVGERLFDPLVHILRNACDHGLEPPDERIAVGKGDTGTIRLAAHQAGGAAVITISDDGRGVSRARVRTKAEASGLVQPGEVLSDAASLALIFHPGFSTAAAVTNLSGRGVGMDVVKREIERLRGTIELVSTEGAGTTITLRIPLTLAIIDGLLVRVGTVRYVIPLATVEECLELSAEEDRRSLGRSLITLRDRLVPFLRLRELFASDAPPGAFQKIVVVATGRERVGLVVDQIVGSHQTVVKALSPFHRGIGSFSGATILGDGGVALILDVAQLVARGQQIEAAMEQAA
ncbi:chemotaxis protein CheA [Sphingomonas sp. BK069]|uniref:chemotaxis protein CheA n=1 Tax=Sphingomonas sp. BK069 TaxID=2586979 RepID=UPI001618F215|nr:chemotaxis protein CheA [Sphingomonas sp. BK069]MBB3348023.1 two-component system chemotaxis sensor kinase CheA [Sphingomonas sp. BK069]